MASCYVCQTAYSHAGHSAPAEPCDCGLEASLHEATEEQAHDIVAARALWQQNGQSWTADRRLSRRADRARRPNIGPPTF